jgi:hypothetical protein
MTKIRMTAVSTLVLQLALALPAAAQPPAPRAATLRATGTFANNGTFAGTVTINRFEQRGDRIVALGVVQGTLSRPNRVIGTVVAGEVALPVKVSTGGVQLAANQPAISSRLAPALWSADAAAPFHLMRVQTQGCTPLQINIGATTIDIGGAQVALDPIALTLTGAAGTPLGDLVCAASDLLGNVAGVVNLLNSLLGVLTGLLGGLTGGLGGIAGGGA